MTARTPCPRPRPTRSRHVHHRSSRARSCETAGSAVSNAVTVGPSPTLSWESCRCTAVGEVASEGASR